MSLFRSIRNFGSNHPIIAIGMAVAGIVASYLAKRRRRAGGHFQLGEKDGFLGGNGLGKND